MMDERVKTLAKSLVHYSTRLKAGEKVLIDTTIGDMSLARALVDEAFAAGAIPFVNFMDNTILRKLLQQPSREMWQARAKVDAEFMEMMDAYIAVRGHENVTELSDVPAQAMKHYQMEWLQPVHMEIRVPKKKWVVLRWPSPLLPRVPACPLKHLRIFIFRYVTWIIQKCPGPWTPWSPGWKTLTRCISPVPVPT